MNLLWREETSQSFPWSESRMAKDTVILTIVTLPTLANMDEETTKSKSAPRSQTRSTGRKHRGLTCNNCRARKASSDPGERQKRGSGTYLISNYHFRFAVKAASQHVRPARRITTSVGTRNCLQCLKSCLWRNAFKIAWPAARCGRRRRSARRTRPACRVDRSAAR